MKKMLHVLSALLLVLMQSVCLPTMAQKPKWVGNTPLELNDTYKFVEVISYGSSVAGARQDAKLQLAQNEQLQNAVMVNVETGLKSHEEETINSKGKSNSKYTEEVDIKMSSTGEVYKLQANAIDEWNAGTEGGLVKLHTLFMVAVKDKPQFDRTYLTDSYGATPVVMSIIPGLGQWYKGSKVKGACLFGATAVAAGVGLWCENERASYEKKITQQPKFAKDYETKRDNYETARNVCLAAAAVVWVYNLIDAGTAKGARRVEVKPAGGSFSMVPSAPKLDYTGVTLAYRF